MQKLGTNYGGWYITNDIKLEDRYKNRGTLIL